MILQFQPKQSVATKQRQRIQTSAKRCAQVIDIRLERIMEHEAFAIVVFDRHTHYARVWDSALKQLFYLTCNGINRQSGKPLQDLVPTVGVSEGNKNSEGD